MSLSRRKFLETSAIGGAIAAVTTGTAQAANPCRLPTQWDKTYDVVVIGAGGAGLSSSIAAAENGAKVLLVEKNSYIGGNTILSGGGFNAAVKEAEAAGVKDSPQLHFEQTYAAGDRLAWPELLKTFTDNAPDTVRWLKSLGMQFRPIYQIYGGLWPRARSPIGLLGADYFKVCVPRAKELGVDIMMETKVNELIRERPLKGRVVGLEATGPDGKVVRIKANKGIIVCAGGFASNAEMCGRFDPRMKKLGTTNNRAVSTGEMLLAMQDIGAGTTGMSFIQCNPGPAPGKKVKCVMNQFVTDFIFVNKEGKRFINEDARRDVMRDAVLAQTDAIAFNMVDGAGFERLKPSNGKNNEAALLNNALFYADTLEELADKLGIPKDQFVKTIQEFNAAVDTKKDPLGRAPSMMVRKLEKAPFYAGPITMARHHTMGGATITTKCEVIDRKGNVISGLYAAGEVTGGIHGTNRVGGNAVADAFTMGRIAGRSAATAS